MGHRDNQVAAAVRTFCRRLFSIGQVGMPSNLVTHIDVWYVQDGYHHKMTYFAKDRDQLLKETSDGSRSGAEAESRIEVLEQGEAPR